MLFQRYSAADALAAYAAAPQPRARTIAHRVAVLASEMTSTLVTGFAFAAIAISPEFYFAIAADAERRSATADLRSGRWPSAGRAAAGAFTPRHSLAPSRRHWLLAWVRSLAELPRIVGARLRRRWELRRLCSAWDMVDDRMLKDIGLSRHAITQLGGERHWR